jgi:hypothetical protein
VIATLFSEPSDAFERVAGSGFLSPVPKAELLAEISEAAVARFIADYEDIPRCHGRTEMLLILAFMGGFSAL